MLMCMGRGAAVSDYAFDRIVDTMTGVFGTVLEFLAIEFADASREHVAAQSELRELAEPYMPVLMHKREKLKSCIDGDPRWAAELSQFVGNTIWPQVAKDEAFAGRSQQAIVHLLDGIIASAQSELSERNVHETTPVTWRVDTGWAS
jgi:hypothetical protein